MSYSGKPNSQDKNKSKKKIDFNHDHPAKKKKILTVVNEETGEIEARVNLTNHMYSSGNWFAFFQKSAVYLAQNLGKDELRVLMFMLSKMDYGNYIRVTNKNICNNLQMQKSNVSRAIRNLLEKNVIAVAEWYGISRIYMMNPTFLHKGKNFYQTQREYKELREQETTEEAMEVLEMDPCGRFK